MRQKRTLAHVGNCVDTTGCDIYPQRVPAPGAMAPDDRTLLGEGGRPFKPGRVREVPR